RFTGTIQIELPLGAGVTLRFPIDAPIVSMRLDPAHGSATGGVIAGTIATDAMLAALHEAAQEADPSLSECLGPGRLDTQFERASDILQDGTQDPARACDGISIGLGFEAVRAAIGPVGAPFPTPPDPCAPDAGAMDGG